MLGSAQISTESDAVCIVRMSGLLPGTAYGSLLNFNQKYIFFSSQILLCSSTGSLFLENIKELWLRLEFILLISASIIYE